MHTIELSDQEIRLLAERLESMLVELRMEIADTDDAGFKRGLRSEQGIVQMVLGKLRAHTETVNAV